MPRATPADLDAYPRYMKRLADEGGSARYLRPICRGPITYQHSEPVQRDLERLARKIGGLATAGLGRFGPAVIDQPHMADRRPGERQPVMPIDSDRLLEQTERLENPLFRYRIEGGKRAQSPMVASFSRGTPPGMTIRPPAKASQLACCSPSDCPNTPTTCSGAG
ncbi:hypothetical protein B4Q13_17930 [Lacticaseibacillus rhamnosus]